MVAGWLQVGCGKLVSPERLIVVMRVDSTAIGRPSLSVCPVVAGLAGRRRLARLWLEGELPGGVAGGVAGSYILSVGLPASTAMCLYNGRRLAAAPEGCREGCSAVHGCRAAL